MLAVGFAWLVALALFLVLCALSSCRAHREVETQGVNISEVASAQIGSRRTALLATSFPLELPVNLFRDSSRNAPGAHGAPAGPSWVLAVEEVSSECAANAQHRQRLDHEASAPVSHFKLIDYVCAAVAFLGVLLTAFWYRRRQP